MLVGQGANDPRVPPKESEQMVEAIRKRGGTVEYVVYPDEGHGFTKPANRMDFYERTERFLARCLK
ncbi:MAG: prolyl oligopeptidase family serine peptidase [Myxococcales bacterium]